MRPFSEQNLDHDLEEINKPKNKIEILIDELIMLSIVVSSIYFLHYWSKV
jgi:hypothetical protein